LPIWLSPVQVAVLSITEQQADYARQFSKALHRAGIRSEYDVRNEKISYKIREQTLARVPLMAIVGNAEMDSKTVTFRSLSGKNLGCVSLEDWLINWDALIQQDITESNVV